MQYADLWSLFGADSESCDANISFAAAVMVLESSQLQLPGVRTTGKVVLFFGCRSE